VREVGGSRSYKMPVFCQGLAADATWQLSGRPTQLDKLLPGESTPVAISRGRNQRRSVNSSNKNHVFA
jgi:hypothetical protein